MRKYGMGSADSATAGQEKAKSPQAAPKAEPTAKAEAAAAVPAAKAAQGA